MLSSSKSLLLVGLGGLLHAGYTATQYRAYIRLTSQEFVALPADIVVYTLFCLAITFYALGQVVCTFREIRTYEQSAQLRWDSLFNRQSFISFNHRSKALSGFLSGHQDDSLADTDLQSQLLFNNTVEQPEERDNSGAEESRPHSEDEQADSGDA